jgi:hypothetical protein
MACVDGQAPDDSGEMDDNQWMYTESGETPCISVLRGINAVERECIADVKDWWGRAAGSGVMWQSSLHQ